MRSILLLSGVTALLFQACRFDFEVSTRSGVGSGANSSEGGQGGAPEGSGGGPDSGSAGEGTGGSDPQCVDWLDASRGHRRRVSFENSQASDALNDFTVLVVLTAQNFDYDQTAPFGRDVQFLDSVTGAVLVHHIDTWNEGSTSTLWVQVPELEPNDTDHIWMYYGGEDATASPSSASYDDDYRAVWHLSESSGPLVDSTSSTVSLAWNDAGSGSQEAAGRIGLAIEPRDGDGATSTGGELDGLENHTLTAWVRMADVPGADLQQTIFSAEGTSAPFPGVGMYVDQSSRQVGTWADNGYRFSSTAANQLLLEEWAFVAMRADTSATSGIIELKVNGGEWETVYSGDASSAATLDGSSIQVATWLGPFDANFEGRIDEIQLSSGLRSDDWVDAQYRSQANLGFVNVGSEDTCESP